MKKNPTITIVVATHKEATMPKESMYLPLQVGAKGKVSIGYQRDDTGDNISEKNPKFCELTGLYWAWKNLESDYIGLVQYRRYFTQIKGKSLFHTRPGQQLLTEKQLQHYLPKSVVLLPQKQNYMIETVRSHYEHTHGTEDLDQAEQIIRERCPDYLPDFQKVMNQRKAHMFNMGIFRRDYLNDYCSWLFPILFELENRIDVTEKTDFEIRLFGRVSELLLNVWLEHAFTTGGLKKRQVKILPWTPTEELPFYAKLKAFLKAKFLGVKYNKSF